MAMMALALLSRPIGDGFFSQHTMIASSLLTLIAYQVGSLVVFSSIANGPDPPARACRD